MSLAKEFTKGIYIENPVFRLVLGMCPILAVTTSVENALGMGAAATFVLLGSNTLVSMLRKIIPNKIRIPCYIVIIASFVTIVELVMKGYFPALDKSLGIFIPLIVVNCIILGRAEAFAGKKGVMASIMDAIGMGVGFTLAMILLATFREILGSGTWLGFSVLPSAYKESPMLLMILAPGGFLTLGLLMGFFNWLELRKKKVDLLDEKVKVSK